MMYLFICPNGDLMQRDKPTDKELDLAAKGAYKIVRENRTSAHPGFVVLEDGEWKDVAVTCDTAQMFFDAAREVGSVDTDTMPDGTPVTIYERLQLRKGDTRDDVYIADFGEFRAVVIC